MWAAFVPARAQNAATSDSAFIRRNYTKHEYRIPMRDGVRLFTIVYAPNDASAARRYPFVMQRTCYSVAPPAARELTRTLADLAVEISALGGPS